MAGLTPKHEQFARAIAIDLMHQNEAYSRVYDCTGKSPSTIQKAASTLANSEAVAARIAVLRQGAEAAAVKKAGYTLADAIREVDELVEMGRNLGQTSAAVAAAKLKAQLAGHLVEKKEVRTGSLEEDDIAKLKLIRAEIDARIKHKQDVAAVTGEGQPEERKVANGVTRRVFQ